ncbi:TrbC/VirB2 family protein [Salinibacter sp. 10B]|uniref:TrbC/VirB2 family protein n=1 Tax=Salinibacter sp. 10B TaxID=1923971 RepID=UPI0015E307D1|nr:TrbC/VirB2 family protein [Salinibacter sp. 10B]
MSLIDNSSSNHTSNSRRPLAPLSARGIEEEKRRGGSASWVLLTTVACMGFLLALGATPAFAAGTTAGVPWETALTSFLDIFSGQTARLLAALMFIGGAVIWGFSRNEEGFQMIGKVIVSAGLIIGAAALSTTIFGAVV